MPVFHKGYSERRANVRPADGAVEEAVLDIEGLRFRYPDGRAALRDVSLRVHRGEKVALVGPNGAGKSTLMLHLNGILCGDDGAVRVAGLPVAETHLATIRALVGLVFQNPEDPLFRPNGFAAVALGPLHLGFARGDVRPRVGHALMQVGMADYAGRLSHHLSMGEKKRAAIATVLANQPDVLVLDEPSAGLDPRARRKLIELLHALPLTMLVATHDMRMVRDLLPRAIIMDEGAVVADGPTEVLFDDVALLEEHGLERP